MWNLRMFSHRIADTWWNVGAVVTTMVSPMGRVDTHQQAMRAALNDFPVPWALRTATWLCVMVARNWSSCFDHKSIPSTSRHHALGSVMYRLFRLSCLKALIAESNTPDTTSSIILHLVLGGNEVVPLVQLRFLFVGPLMSHVDGFEGVGVVQPVPVLVGGERVIP